MINQREYVDEKVSNRSKVQESYRCGATPCTLNDLIRRGSGRSRTASKQLIASSRVSIEGEVERRPHRLLAPGERVTVHERAVAKAFSHPLARVVYETEHFVVAHKSAGLYTVNTTHKDRRGTLLWLLSQYYKEREAQSKLFMVTRLDKQTAGFVLFARSEQAKEVLNTEWHRIVRTQEFAAVVSGDPGSESRLLTASSKPKEEAKKRTKTREMSCRVTPLRSSPYGHMHVVSIAMGNERIFSLRKLLGDNGLVIVGDGRNRSDFGLKEGIALVQTRLALEDPFSHKALSFDAPMPTHFFSFLKKDREEREKKYSQDDTRKSQQRL